MTIQPYEQEFWAMLGPTRLGIDITLEPPFRIEQHHATLNELGDYPMEWFPKLEQACINNGVQKVSTVLNYMKVSKARNIPPGERPADKPQEAELPDPQTYYSRMLERACACDSERCVEHVARIREMAG